MEQAGFIGFGAFGLIFILMFIVVSLFIIGVFIYIVTTHAKKANYNKNSPELCIWATVVSKREQVRGENTYTFYFATFEFKNGDRIELELKGQESGMLVEGDQGQLTYKGLKFIDFERGK